MATVYTTTYDSVTDTTALTITLASLATSSSLLVGREATAISEVSTMNLGRHVMGQIMTGTSPTAGVIEVWAYGITKHVSSTPSYPSPITGSDAAITFVAETKPRRLIASMATNATSNTPYSFDCSDVEQLFGGFLPIKWGIVVIHNTAVNLNATAGNHWIHMQGLKVTGT